MAVGVKRHPLSIYLVLFMLDFVTKRLTLPTKVVLPSQKYSPQRNLRVG